MPTPPPHKSFPEHKSNEVLTTSNAEAFKAAGNKFFRMQAYDQAVEEYSKAVQANPQNPVYLSNRSAALMSAHKYMQAFDDAKLALALDPRNNKIMLRLARIYTAIGQPAEALAVFEQIQPPVAEKDQAPATAMLEHIVQAETYSQAGSGASMVLHALDQAEKGLGHGVGRPHRWRILRGEAYLKICSAKAIEDAMDIATSLLRENGQDPEAMVLRGKALYVQGENEKALQHFRQALGFDPDFKNALSCLRMVQRIERLKEEGNAAFKAGRYSEAIGIYGTALHVDPSNKRTNARLLQNRALAAMKVGGTLLQYATIAYAFSPVE